MYWRAQVSRLVVGLAAVASLGAIMAGSGAADSPTLPAITVSYRPDCSITVMISGLTADPYVPGPTIPPGPYAVQVTTQLPDAMFDPASCTAAQFSLTGPGVNWATVLKYGGLYNDQTTVTLAPSALYTAADANAPSTQTRFFTTAATGSSSSLLIAPPSSTSSVAQSQKDVIGSRIVPFRGALQATVASSGKAELELHGKSIARVKAGKYDIVATDASKRSGIFVQKGVTKAVTVTTLAFTGKKTVRVTLSHGKWKIFSKSGAAALFVVD